MSESILEKIKLIILVDDSDDDNFLHKRSIRKAQIAEQVKVFVSVQGALEYLIQSPTTAEWSSPNLILLDLNFPGMDGWDFLQEYANLPEVTRARYNIVVLTTSRNPEEQKQVLSHKCIVGHETKPLTVEKLQAIYHQYYT